jgi:putative PEP-CTERM system histidine kinase
MVTAVGLFSHFAACAGFAGLAFWLIWRPGRAPAALWLALACSATALWAGSFVFAARFGGGFLDAVSPLETLRTAAWIAFLVVLLAPSWRLAERTAPSFVIAVVLGALVALQLAVDLADDFGIVPMRQARPADAAWLFVLARLAAAIGGLLLVHNLYVNALPSHRWSIRLLCIGLAGVFGYDLNLYTLALLGGLEADLLNARGIANALVVPLLAISAARTAQWRVQVSRRVALQTFSLGVVGAYLMAMAVAAYALRLVGGDWARLAQIALLFGGAVLGAVVVFSGKFRASARVWIAKHFFAYKYDYREEWLRFIATVSRTDDGLGGIEERVVQGMAQVVDSPGGALFTPTDGAFGMRARWNWRGFAPDRVDAGSDFAAFLADTGRIADIDEMRDGRGDYGGAAAPPFLDVDPDAWLVVPLPHLDRLAGFVVLQRSLALRELNWEDYDLLRTVGRQSASYIAERASQTALEEAKKFDEFNRRFAFIMHDIKNLVSQLALLARNAERHADNPEFRADMIATLKGATAKMNDLLARLSQHNTGRAVIESVDLGRLLDAIVAAKRGGSVPVTLTAAAGVAVAADRNRLEQVFAHLIQNAIDATTGDKMVEVVLVSRGGDAVVTIRDQGCGMSPAFVRDDLFQPFRSTKAGGFGIGAYEAREILRGLGGRLDVVSREGEGSVFTATLPLGGGRA